jgi:transcriptional regulator with GAF, ATPase, and Fis domain
VIAGRRRDRLGSDVRATLQRFSALGDRDLDDDGFFAELATAIAETVRAEKAAVAILHGDELRVRGAFGFPQHVVATVAVRVDASHPGLAERLLFGDSVFAGDLRVDDEELAPYRDVLNSMGVHNAIAVGWRGGGRPLGTMAAFDSTRADGFEPRDAVLLELAAEVSSFVFRQGASASALRRC